MNYYSRLIIYDNCIKACQWAHRGPGNGPKGGAQTMNDVYLKLDQRSIKIILNRLLY